jgi:1-deoxy-D-xylulose-5-phosphate reductoisomerase
VDSEHNAIHQCLHRRAPSEIRRLLLTASGGPFRTWSSEQLAQARPDDALRHPTWQMGRKITIDSATLMNKGLEVIEARWLFDVPGERIDVLVHPQSIVHSMVELTDGSTMAQLGITDMRLPIQYAFSYPERWTTTLPSLDLTRSAPLEFLPPDIERFPCLRLAYDALAVGGTAPVALNAANEVAVDAFLAGRLPFHAIARVIEATLTAHDVQDADTVGAVRDADRWAHAFSRSLAGTLELHV